MKRPEPILVRRAPSRAQVRQVNHSAGQVRILVDVSECSLLDILETASNILSSARGCVGAFTEVLPVDNDPGRLDDHIKGAAWSGYYLTEIAESLLEAAVERAAKEG